MEAKRKPHPGCPHLSTPGRPWSCKYSQKSTKVIKRTPSGHLSKVGVLEHLVGGSNKRGVSQMDLSLKFCIGVVEVMGFSYSEFVGAN